ncbi:outer membrane protein assembly factor BamC [Actimicrobium sp. CCI2.3]|uniref:outer membrane protein assembly factor BamC n=1 Tax=Actimicrobium sp. CCI2.3 TaxID=3048616 RepID=UPI002AB482A3|nr:outer membrane protein assembly factor BamC [Actimicrobium sp. CCI2.3]MDY7574674.1 outer membrane protein assembly factor BamC [Actimicrobium sp. CCI2.3]MEB0020369.1 outer membrane protein assembly factor BamC [Actimicrobium sp. CCI2.3]
MTLRSNPEIARGLVLAVALTGLAGCGSISSLVEPERLDYKSASKASTVNLEVPPDLTQLKKDSRYAIPESNRGTATASSYTAQTGTQPVATSAIPEVIAPKGTPEARVMRDGNERWLVVKASPEVLWPQIKDFWQDSGFLINIEKPEAGVMETDWAENRAKIPQDFIRKTLGKVIDSLYSTGERDKFRTRLERGADGTTEVYISHRGAEEVVTGQQRDGTIWTPRPADPGLEAEFLSRLMARLGVEEVKAKTIVAQAVQKPDRSKLGKDADGAYVEVDEGFDRAWRRVGLSLDRVGFTVEDRDRVEGMYFVRYIDLGQDAQSKSKADNGFFSRLFSSSDDKVKKAQRYRVLVKQVGTISRITVLNDEGKPEKSGTADRILTLVNEQLK